MFKCVLGHLVC